MNHSTTNLSPELEAEADRLLSAHIIHHITTTLEEAVSHYPAILNYFAHPTNERPAAVPEWIYSAVFEATDPDGALCWPVLRGSLLSRAYSLASGCYISKPSLALKTAMVELGLSFGHDGDPDDSSTWIECASLTGSGVAKALGVSLYRLLLEQMNELERNVKPTFSA